MVSLSNQARLLAAQAFNKKVLEDKARAKQAEIDAEARAQEQKRFQRQRDLLAKQTATQSANVRAFQEQRLEDDIKRQQATAKEQARVATIRKTAEIAKAKVFSRVAKGANIGVLTGFEADRNSKGQQIGISKRESATRKNTRALLIREIEQQRLIASRETDLERFLKNERAINAGQVSSKALNRQIAERKARGLSKTPAQKRASQFFRDSSLQSALSARTKRKGGSQGQGEKDVRASFGGILSERNRALGLGSTPFADPLFAGGGRSKEAIIGRGGTFGRRTAGQSISSQLSFISQTKAKSTSARIGFASSLLAGLGSGGIFSGGASQDVLLGFVKQKTIATPKTFQAELREGVGFFTTIQKPVTKPKITKAQRARLVSNRKAEDKIKAETARATISATKAGTRKAQRDNASSLRTISANLLSSNIDRAFEIESINAKARPRISRGQAGFVENERNALGFRLAQQQIDDFGLRGGLAQGGIGLQGGNQGIDSVFGAGTTVQRNIQASPTQLGLLSKTANIGSDSKGNFTVKTVDGVERFFNAKGDQIKGKRLIDIKQARANTFGQGGSGFDIVDGVARANDSQRNIFDPRLAQAQRTQSQTDALRKSGGTGSGLIGGSSILDPARNFGRETLGFGFDEDIVSRQAGLVKATGVAGSTEVNIFDINPVSSKTSVGLTESLSLQTGGLRSAVSPTTTNFEANFTESLGLTDSAKPKTKKGSQQTLSQVSAQSRDNFFSQAGDSLTGLFSFGATPSTSSKKASGKPKGSQGNLGVLGDFINIARGSSQALNIGAISQGARAKGVDQGALDREILKNLGFGF